jgi:hypothetical protein
MVQDVSSIKKIYMVKLQSITWPVRIGLIFLTCFQPKVPTLSKLVINHVDKLAKQTPLYYAARKGHL